MSETSLSLPNGWAQKPLSSLIDGLESGVSVNADDRPSIGLELGVLKTSSVSGGKFFPGEHKAVWEKDRKRVRRTPSAGSIIISRMNTPDLVGESGYVLKDENQLFLPDRLWQTVARTGCDADFRWLAQVLQWPPVKKKIKDAATGTSNSMKNISKYSLLRLEVPVPPAIEQRRIAEILSTLDEQIEQTEALILKKRLAKAGFSDLLFSDVSSCSTQPLSHYIAGLESGVSVNGDDRQKQGSEVGVLKTSCVVGGRFIPSEHKAVWEQDTTRAKLNPSADSIIISRMNTPELVGESGYVEATANDLFLPDRLWQTVKNQSVKSNFRWLSQVLQWRPVRKAIKDRATGTSNSMKNISKAAFLGIRIPALPIESQLVAAEVLGAADAEIESLTQEVEKLSLQRQGLMHDLLTGKTRVPQ